MIPEKAQLQIMLNFEGSQKSPDWNNYNLFLLYSLLKYEYRLDTLTI